MNKHFSTLAVAIAALTSCTHNGVKLSGTIENAQGEKIVLEQLNLDKHIIVDSAKISSNGTFTLNAPLATEPTFYKATIGSGKSITFIADSNETILVKADAAQRNWNNSVKFDNSPASQDLQTIISKASALQYELQKHTNMAEIDLATRRALSDSIDSYKAFIQGYVFQNPRSFVSYYALFQNIIDLPLFDVMNSKDQVLFATVATSLNIAHPNNTRAKHLYDYVLQAKAIQKQNKMNAEILNSANEVKSPDLNLPTLDGTPAKLSDMRGKVVILQFWTSTDQQSRKLNRQLGSVYNKYKGKGLEIYQVSFDTSKLLWEDAISKDKLVWTNVCDMMGAGSIAARLYNVSAVPSNYIIDRDGALIGKDLFGRRLDERLSEIFK